MFKLLKIKWKKIGRDSCDQARLIKGIHAIDKKFIKTIKNRRG